jgi:RimJ/RimL family protein N-acetyltransferase
VFQVLSLFSSNDRALHVYEKAGYCVAGRIPKAILKSGEYVDELVMTKELPEPT